MTELLLVVIFSGLLHLLAGWILYKHVTGGRS